MVTLTICSRKDTTICNKFQITTNSVAETIQLGRKIGITLKGGEVIALIGALGSGKTHLVKGIASGAGAAEAGRVNSPTFVIINEYSSVTTGLDIYHVDAYRIDSIAEFEMLGFDDLCRRDSVVLIEWADKVLAALKNIDSIEIKLSHVDQHRRKIQIKNIPQYIIEALNA